MSDLPKAISESTLTIMGVEIICVMLDNGQRVFESAGVERLFEMMAGGAEPTPAEALLLGLAVRP